MDNSFLLLIFIKRGVNVGAFIEWLSHFGCIPKYDDYMTFETDCIVYNGKPYQEGDRLGTEYLTEFEFNYVVCSLGHYGYLKYE